MRIIQISDLHFGMHNQTIIDLFMQDIKTLKPELILISGDLTQRAKESQFKLMHDFLKQLPAPYLTIPGNHDIPLYNLFRRLLQPFKNYKQYISKELESQFINKKVNILGVNSVDRYKIKNGLLDSTTLQRIKNHFSATSGQLNILFFHHNLNYFSGLHHPLSNAEEFMSYLKESPIHIVCTGHLHYANVKIIRKNESENFALLHAGSLSCIRTKDKINSFYVIDIKEPSCSISIRIFENNRFRSEEIHNLVYT